MQLKVISSLLLVLLSFSARAMAQERCADILKNPNASNAGLLERQIQIIDESIQERIDIIKATLTAMTMANPAMNNFIGSNSAENLEATVDSDEEIIELKKIRKNFIDMMAKSDAFRGIKDFNDYDARKRLATEKMRTELTSLPGTNYSFYKDQVAKFDLLDQYFLASRNDLNVSGEIERLLKIAKGKTPKEKLKVLNAAFIALTKPPEDLVTKFVTLAQAYQIRALNPIVAFNPILRRQVAEDNLKQIYNIFSTDPFFKDVPEETKQTSRKTLAMASVLPEAVSMQLGIMAARQPLALALADKMRKIDPTFYPGAREN